MSARDLVLQLRAMGMSNRAIGREIGRNDRLIKYVADGDKPGTNLEAALRGLVEKKGGNEAAVVPAVPRRRDGSGRTAKVRRKTFYAGGRTVRVKAGAIKSGAKSLNARLAEAAAAGARVAFTVTFNKHARLSKSDGTSIPPSGTEQTADVGNKGNGLPAAWINGAAGGDIAGWLVQYLIDSNRLASPSTPIGLEMRVWDGTDAQADGDASAGMI